MTNKSWLFIGFVVALVIIAIGTTINSPEIDNVYGDEGDVYSIDGTSLSIFGDIADNNQLNIAEDKWAEITKVVIADNVRNIASDVLKQCTNVNEIVANIALKENLSSIFGSSSYPDAVIWLNDNGVQHLILKSLPDQLGNTENVKTVVICTDATSLPDSIFKSLRSSKVLDSVVIDCPNVTSLNGKAFSGISTLKTVEVHGAIALGDMAFANCSSLESVAISENLVKLGYQCFFNDSSLVTVSYNGKTGIVLPDGVELGNDVFRSCSSVKYVEYGVGKHITSTFQDCTGLEKVVIRDGVTSVNTNEFIGCTSLETVIFPNTMINLGQSSFEDCHNLKTIELNGCNLNLLGSCRYFKNCNNLQTMIVSDTNLIFMPKSENGTIHVPEGIDTITTYAFNACTTVKEIYLPDSISSIELNAFSTCKELTAIHGFHSGIAVGRHAFAGTSIEDPIICNGKIYYIPDSLEYSDYVVTSDIKEISNSAFEGNKSLKSVRFENDSGIILGDYIFKDCINLESVHFGNVEFIYTGMFNGCKSLREIDLSGITYIYAYAFFESGLRTVTLPESVSTIEESVFRDCTELVSVIFDCPDVVLKSPTVNGLVDSVFLFSGCKKLENIKLPANMTMLPSLTFYECSSLTNITLPSSLTSIGTSCFSYSGLTEIELPEGLAYIGTTAFRECKNLRSIIFPSSMFDGDGQEPAFGSYAMFGIGTNTPNGADVTIRGCPTLIHSENLFKGAKINTLFIESAPFFSVNYIFTDCSINTIIVGGGVGFKYQSINQIPLYNQLSDGCIPVQLYDGNSNVSGRMLCVSNGDTLSIAADVVSISATLLVDSKFKSIHVDPENQYFQYVDGALIFNSPEGEKILVYVDKSGFDSSTIYTVPAGVTEIGSYAFSGSSTTIDTIILPDSVTKLDILSARYSRNIVVESNVDLPKFDMNSTSRSKLFCSSSLPEEIITSIYIVKSFNGTDPIEFGGYYIHDGNSLLLLQMPLESADIELTSTGSGFDIIITPSRSFDKSVFTVMDGNVEIEKKDGKYHLSKFTGSKLLKVDGFKVNEYGFTYDSDDSFSLSTSLIDVSKIVYGTTLEISITPNPGFHETDDFKVIINDKLMETRSESGRYVCLFDVFADIHLSVSGIVPDGTFTVSFDSDNSESPTSVTVNSGSTVGIPAEPTKTGFRFFGWYNDGSLFDFSKEISGNLTLVAHWVPEETPTYVVNVDSDNGCMTIINVNSNKAIANGSAVLSGTSLLFVYEPFFGYEVRSWTINDSVKKTISNAILEVVESDMKVSVVSEYTTSAFPYLETDIKAPTSNEEGVMYWKVQGTTGFNNMVFTPSIMGDYVYSWSGSQIFKICLATGKIVKTVDTGFTNSLYYNLTTVGNGYVLAGYAGQVYDRDLNPVFKLHLDENTLSQELKTYYQDGYFYVFTKEMGYRFLAEDNDPETNNIQLPTDKSETMYTHYISSYQGQSNLIFTDDFIIGIEYSGGQNQNRYLVTYDINTMKYIDSFLFTEIESSNLNTGYISYYNGTVYFNTYSPNSNMFGTANGSWNTMSSIELDSRGYFVPITIHYYDLGTTSYPSSLIVVGDYGYINAGDNFIVFDMKTMTRVGIVPSTMSHGNMAVSVQGDVVYAYLIPYTNTSSLYVFKHDQSTNTLTKIILSNIVEDKQYGSQIVHFGPHGELLYYNDSGYLFCVGFKYTIEFVSEGSAVNSMEYLPNKSFTLPTSELDGKIFVGWYDNADFDGNALTEIPVGTYGNLKLYAKFVIPESGTHTVKFLVGEDEYYTYASDTGDLVKLPDAPTNPNNARIEFLAWSGYSDGMAVSGDLVFRALWKGDVNGDGFVNAIDIVALKNCLNNEDYSIVSDVNGDGFVNAIDLVALKNILQQC